MKQKKHPQYFSAEPKSNYNFDTIIYNYNI